MTKTLPELFAKALQDKNLSPNTIASYKATIKQFYSLYSTCTRKDLLAYKSFLIDHYKLETVNLKITAINKFIDLFNKQIPKLKTIKQQQKTFVENVISDADYHFLKIKLKHRKNKNWYFVVRYLAATGARVSELTQIKIEHVRRGYLDIYGKGGKIRRLFIPKKLMEETIAWLGEDCLSGYLFKNRFNTKLTERGVRLELKRFAKKYGMNTDVVYPHSFRHRFAKNFLCKCNDISLLADLMGHDSIETTRIYLRKSSTEQQDIVNKVVTW